MREFNETIKMSRIKIKNKILLNSPHLNFNKQYKMLLSFKRISWEFPGLKKFDGNNL